jgi:hypothetical protein
MAHNMVPTRLEKTSLCHLVPCIRRVRLISEYYIIGYQDLRFVNLRDHTKYAMEAY